MGYTHGKQWSDDMIRAAILGVQNTLCIGVKNSKYHVYTDRWDLLNRASEFWKGLVA